MRLKIYINDTLLDVNDDLNLSFTYNISDVREPESRQASFSKTIVIPASKTNNIVFTNVFDVAKEISTTGLNFTPDFNPNKRANTRVTVDDLLVMDGYCQMLKINKVNYEVDSYEIVIFNNVKNIFEEFGEDLLTSLDLSAYDQEYSTANVNAYSYGNPSPSYTLGEGLIYNSVYNGTEPIGTYKVAPYPSTFVKTYVDAIFTKYGYEYDSNFFTSTYFKKLCVPFVKKQYTLTQDEVVERQFKLTNAGKISSAGGSAYESLFNISSFFTKSAGVNEDKSANLLWFNEVQDVSNLYDISNDPYTVFIKKGGRHTIYFSATVASLTFDCPLSITSGNLIFTLNFKLYRNRGGVLTLLATSTHPYYVGAETPVPATPDKIIMGSQTFNIAIDEITNPNDEYLMALNYTTSGELYNGATPLQVLIYSNSTNTYEFYNVVDNTSLAIDNSLTVEANRLTPNNVKIKDFMSSLVKCFNLQVDVDKDEPKKLIIEPYNDYFGSGTEKDWTSKLDVAKIEIIPMADLITNTFKFGFENDDDLINKDYTEVYKETYGDYEIKVDNDFATQTKEIKPIFAASPCTRRSNVYFTGNVTYLAKDENEGRDAKIRMVWYNGLETDDVTNPTVAIRYDLAPSQLYYNTTTLTNQTLYGKFWKKYVEEVTDKNSKMVVCYLNLTPLDISQFQFTDNIFIDGHFFRVNKIIDFNPLSEGLTKVELIKINFFAPLQEDTVTVYEQAISYNVVEGGVDEIRDENATSFYNILEGSENEIRDLGATSPNGIVDGGQNLI